MFATLGPVEISLDLSILLIRFQQTTRSSSVNSRKPAQANKNAIEVQLTTKVNNNVVTNTIPCIACSVVKTYDLAIRIHIFFSTRS